MTASLTTVAYLIAGVLFILSLSGLSTQQSARRGNLYGMIGMLAALLVTAASNAHSMNYGVLAAAVGIGGLIGGLLAVRVEMTAMPELVAILHSFVGLAAVLVGFGTYFDAEPGGRRRAGDSRARGVHRRVRRLAHVYRFGDRVRQAARLVPQQTAAHPRSSRD
ncbi:MAG: NAD(P)(+) transhydrogenase (Re/Si-specific) subunit beta [Polyangiaceae bacterium]